MRERDPIFETDRMITTMTGFMVVALALLVGFGREMAPRHNAPPTVEVCHVSASPEDRSERACRGGDCPTPDDAKGETAPASGGLGAVRRALKAGAG